MLLQSTKRLQPRDTKGLERNKSIDDFVHLEIAAFLHCYSDNLLEQPFSRRTILEDRGGRRTEVPSASYHFLHVLGGTATAKVRNQQNCKRKLLENQFRHLTDLLIFYSLAVYKEHFSLFQDFRLTCTNITSRMLFKTFKFVGFFCLFVSTIINPN